jgi:hypothetical protein
VGTSTAGDVVVVRFRFTAHAGLMIRCVRVLTPEARSVEPRKPSSAFAPRTDVLSQSESRLPGPGYRLDSSACPLSRDGPRGYWPVEARCRRRRKGSWH